MYFLSPKERLWRKIWPTSLIGLLAIIQFCISSAIIGLEVTSMISDLYHSMIFVGYFCSIFFTITWISMLSITYLDRHSSRFAIRALVKSILSIIAASVLIYFDCLFLNNPYTCLYGSNYDCNSLHRSNTIFNPTKYLVKMACIKAQLVCAVLMVVTNITYIIIFIIVTIKTKNEDNTVVIPQYGNVASDRVGAHTQLPVYYISSV